MRSSGQLHCSNNTVASDWQVANPNLQRIEKGIRDCRSHRSMCGLPGPEWLRVGPVHEFNLHVRHFAEAKNWILRPTVAGDALAVKTNPLSQNPTGCLNRATFYLVDDAIRVNRFANVYRHEKLFDPDI